MARILESLIGHRETLAPLFEAQKTGKLASTLLFAGSSGIGKRLAALALAQALVCERQEDGRACGSCGSCLRLERGQSESLLVVAPDSTQIKIEQARDILQFLSLQKLGRARVVIIDQGHLLNQQAGNALLKSLEEPPEGTYFIVVTSLAAGVLATIRSRSQLVRFKPLSNEELRTLLGDEGDEWVIESAHGSIEAARHLLESREGFMEIEETAASYLRVASSRLPMTEISNLRDLMKDRSAQGFVATLIQGVLRNALRLQAGVAPATQSRFADLQESTAKFDPRSLRILADLSIEFEQDLARNVDRGLILENFAIQWRVASQVR